MTQQGEIENSKWRCVLLWIWSYIRPPLGSLGFCLTRPHLLSTHNSIYLWLVEESDPWDRSGKKKKKVTPWAKPILTKASSKVSQLIVIVALPPTRLEDSWIRFYCLIWLVHLTAAPFSYSIISNIILVVENVKGKLFGHWDFIISHLL